MAEAMTWGVRVQLVIPGTGSKLFKERFPLGTQMQTPAILHYRRLSYLPVDGRAMSLRGEVTQAFLSRCSVLCSFAVHRRPSLADSCFPTGTAS